jgi:hypothetical protein
LGIFPPNPSSTAPRIRDGGVEEEGGSWGDQDRRPGAEPLAAGGVKRIPQARPSEPRQGFRAAHIGGFSSDHSYSASSSTSTRGSPPSPERQGTRAAAQGRFRRGPRRSASPAPGHSTLLVTTSSPPCPGAQVSLNPLSCCDARPSSRGRVRAL